MAFTMDEKPGRGRYQCVYSDDIITLENDDNALPVCPNIDCRIAHETRWDKIGRT